ncbi:hypothetical protein AM499_06915 [Bacillus sp. FJAT-22090]|nr:hypothetical protein AM499_06915 [Bacillus sp. FJAT-22090]
MFVTITLFIISLYSFFNHFLQYFFKYLYFYLSFNSLFIYDSPKQVIVLKIYFDFEQLDFDLISYERLGNFGQGDRIDKLSQSV